MANGGFKAFAYEVTGLGSGAPLEDKMTRCKEVLAALGDGLVGLDQGWSYDDGKTASGGTAILSGDLGSPQSYSLYFRHTSGAKMMLTYNVYGVGFDYTAFVPTNGTGSWRNTASGGLAVSIAPASCGEFDPYAANPVPGDVPLLLGTAGSSSYSNATESFLSSGETTEIFKYFLIVRGTQVIILSKRKNDAGNFNIIFAGDVVDCAHETDAHDYSRFASFSSITGSPTSEKSAQYHGSSYYAFSSYSYETAQFYSCAGAVMRGSYNGCFVRPVQEALDCTGTAANVVRWFPVMLYAEGTTDGSCVMENDGFKGYVNHEVCCITKVNNLAVGQLLDGGNFIYLGGGLIIGWDPANEVTLF